jgi:hypothetical protein
MHIRDSIWLICLPALACQGPIVHDWGKEIQRYKIVYLDSLIFDDRAQPFPTRQPVPKALDDVISLDEIDAIYILRNNTSMTTSGHLYRIFLLIDKKSAISNAPPCITHSPSSEPPEYFFHCLIKTKSNRSIHFMIFHNYIKVVGAGLHGYTQ